MKAAVYIEWLDHCTMDGGGWIDVSKLKRAKPATMITLGFVIREDDVSITVVGTHEKIKKDPVAGGDVTIAKGAILNRKVIDL